MKTKKRTAALTEKLERISRGTRISPDDTLELIRRYYPKAYKELTRLR